MILDKVDEQELLNALLLAFKEISFLLRNEGGLGEANGTANTFDDNQLKVDVKTDKIIFNHLRESKLISEACSEETPLPIRMEPNGTFSCSFDPLDGSSIYEANISVGSIVSVWRGSSLLKQKVANQAFACFCIYGPKTICIIAYTDSQNQKKCSELTLLSDEWKLTRDSITIAPDTKTFSPGNLRAINDSSRYHQMIIGYITQGWTLRYIGGLVPELYHIIAKKQGIHSNVHSGKHKAKLRLLFEVAAMAFIIDSAQGSSFTLDQSGQKAIDILEMTIQTYEERISLVIGSKNTVNEARLLFQ